MMKAYFSKTMILLTIMLMDLLAGTEFDLFVPSFPELQQQFMLSPFWVESLLSVNFIGYCLSLLLVGSLADHYGRKPIILLGLLIFIGGSLLCLADFSFPLILLGRFLQGLGVAAPAILSFLVIADNYPLKQQQVLMSLLNAVMNTSVALAPVLGSYISLYFHWQGNFMTLLVLGLFTLGMTLCFIPSYKLAKSGEKISLQGYLPLLRSKPLLLLMSNLVFMFLPYWIFVGLAPLLYMRDLGVSLAHFGYYQGLLALVFALGSLLFGFVLARYAQKPFLRVASFFYLLGLGCVLLLIVFNPAQPLLITLALLPFIISQVIPSNLLIPLCLNFMPAAKGKVSALLQGARLLLAALGLEFAAYFYQGSFQSLGVFMAFFIFLALITHLQVIKTPTLFKEPLDPHAR